MSNSKYTRKNTPADWLYYDQWLAIDIGSQSATQANRTSIMISLIKKYIDGYCIAADLESNDISWITFLRAYNRCISFDSNGRQFGWNGLIKGLRLSTNKRQKPLLQSGRNLRGGLSGALSFFFNIHQEIKLLFDEYIYASAKRFIGYESKLRLKSGHAKFISLCRSAGVLETEWPLSTKYLGRGSINAYVNKYLEQRYDDIVATQYGDKAKAKSNTGKGIESRIHATRMFDAVELDEHKLHIIGSIGIPTLDGDVRWIAFDRPTLILACDRKSANVLSFKVIFRTEANADDVLDVLGGACGYGTPHEFKNKLYDLKARASMPRDFKGPLEFCGFNQLFLDCALIHLANPVIERVRNIVGCDINYGPVKHFERRPLAERIFNSLEQSGFHRLQQTTGSNTNDPKRQNPENVSNRFKMRIDDFVDLIAAVVRDFNGTTGKRNFGISPNDYLKNILSDDSKLAMIFPELPPLQTGTAPLNVSCVTMKVRGNKKTGRRPYVYFEEGEYFGTLLSDMWEIIGDQVIAHINVSDIRRFEIYTLKGVLIDTVNVRGNWSKSAHSRDYRKYLNEQIRKGYLKPAYDEDPITIHLESLSKELTKNNKSKISKEIKASAKAFAEETRVRSTLDSSKSIPSTQHPLNTGNVDEDYDTSDSEEQEDIGLGFQLKSVNGNYS